MEKLKFYKDNETYSTSRGRWCKYFFNQSNQYGMLMMGETDDYFYFTISLKEGVLSDKYSINITNRSALYKALSQVVQGFKIIDVLEEGTPERKSLRFEKQKDDIKIIFNLTDEERVFYTIEFANLRRLGDTRFKDLVFEDGRNFDVEDERDFRYKFKVRLHNMLNDLEQQYCETKQKTV